MKTGQIFWGILFVTIGGLILLSRFDIVDVDWYFVWDLWPLLLILWGLMIITKDTIAKPFITIVIAFFFGTIIYGTVANIVSDSSYDEYWDEDFEVRKFSEDYDPAIEFADLTLSGGIGTFTIHDRTSKLIRGYAKGDLGQLDFRHHQSENKAFVEIDLDKKDWRMFEGSSKKLLEVELNRNPVWELDFNLGAAKSDFDFSPFKVSRLELNTGATKTKIRLGDQYSDTKVQIQMGAAALNLLVPRESGCRLEGEMALMAKDFDGFTKKNGFYVTSNYDDAVNKIDIKVSGGVSSLEIKRY